MKQASKADTKPWVGPAVGGTTEVYAGTLGRLLAYVVDAVLLTAILFVACMVLGAALGPVVGFQPFPGAPGSRVRSDPSRLIATAAMGAAVSAAYFVGSWMALAGTPGQRLFGIRVCRDADRSRLTAGQSAARWLFLMGPLSLGALAGTLMPSLRAFIGLATPLWYSILLATTLRSRTQRGLHDLCAGSVVTTGGPLVRPATGSRP